MIINNNIIIVYLWASKVSFAGQVVSYGWIEIQTNIFTSW